MRVTESFKLHGFTLIATDEKRPKDWKTATIDGKPLEVLKAFDIGDRIAVKGEHDFEGKEIFFS